MKLSTMARLCLVLLTTIILGGCDPDDPTGPPPQNGGGGDANALIPITFYHIQDSDGGKAGNGVDVVLMFEPNGIADLYTARETEAIAYKGTYSVKDGKITLKFNDADLKADATFTIDTAQKTVTMPFKAFSTTAGSSTWRIERMPVEYNVNVIFAAASVAENLPTQQAMDRVVKYSRAIIEIDKAASNGLQKPSFFFRRKLTDVKPFANGVQLQYNEGPYVDVLLFSWGRGQGKPLTLSPLAGDPRVHLDPVPPKNPTGDPDEKTVLLVIPYLNDHQNVTWYDYDYVNGRVPTPSTEIVHTGWGAAVPVEDMKSTLEKRGYNVQVLKNSDANLVNMIEALSPGKGGRLRSPGFVGMVTHGMANGSILTGMILGDSARWQGALKSEIAKLKAAGFGDLLTYGGGTEDKPVTISITLIADNMRPGGKFYAIALTPKFWDWLHSSRQANFSKSFFFLGACLTDLNSDLRIAVKARAYFAFNVVTYLQFASKALQYFCHALARPTHTAEESYYNLIRVLSTRQMIYTEDKLLDGCVPLVAAQTDSALSIFKGYSWDGEKIIPYWAMGWLGTFDGDHGAIWWLLFSGRWGQNAKDGADGMLHCWNSLWKDGKTGGLGDPICHNKSPGRAPVEEEVKIASYLLSGKNVVGDNRWLIPRWTLNDGR